MYSGFPAFDLLDFAPENYQDSSAFRDIPASNPTCKIMQSYPGSLEFLSGNPETHYSTWKSNDKAPEISRNSRGTVLDSGLILNVLNLQNSDKISTFNRRTNYSKNTIIPDEFSSKITTSTFFKCMPQKNQM